jgi:hypothetical protein
MGDLHPEVMVVAGLYGRHPVVARSLDFMRDTTALPAWMNGISSYSLWWIRTLHDWFQRTGDRGHLARQRDYLVRLLAQVAATVRPDGSHSFPNGLIDWASARDEATTRAGMHALLAWTLQAGAALARELGERRAAAQAATAAARIARGALPVAASKQAAALAVLAGLRSPKEANRRVLAAKPAAGLSPFYGYYVLEARAQAGDIAGGLALLRTYWGGMLDLGATSFWEHFDLDWLKGARPRPSMSCPAGAATSIASAATTATAATATVCATAGPAAPPSGCRTACWASPPRSRASPRCASPRSWAAWPGPRAWCPRPTGRSACAPSAGGNRWCACPPACAASERFAQAWAAAFTPWRRSASSTEWAEAMSSSLRIISISLA